MSLGRGIRAPSRMLRSTIGVFAGPARFNSQLAGSHPRRSSAGRHPKGRSALIASSPIVPMGAKPPLGTISLSCGPVAAGQCPPANPSQLLQFDRYYGMPSPASPEGISRSRRDFLRATTGLVTASLVSGRAGRARSLLGPAPKTVVVTFGGGARDDETFGEAGQQNIPRLLKELLPQGTFFSQVMNGGILGHYVATASIITGNYERFNNFIAQPPPNPTLFEYFRKELRRPSTDAWVIAPSNGFQRIGCSSHTAFGAQYGAGVILPKRLLSAAMHTSGKEDPADRLRHMLQDNYEMPVYAPTDTANDRELHLDMLENTLKISVSDYVQHAHTLNSADELSVYITRHLMSRYAPSLMMLTLHDMDVAHSGAFSLYVDAIRRADRLCGDLWAAIQTDPEYKGRTTLYIMPDFGRDADDDPAGNGFQHHRTGGAEARTTWLLALGPHIRANAVVERPIESIDLVPTIGRHLGFSTLGTGRPIEELA